MAWPLTELLKKNGFLWNGKAGATFSALKAAMTEVPVLALPEFSNNLLLKPMLQDMGWELYSCRTSTLLPISVKFFCPAHAKNLSMKGN